MIQLAPIAAAAFCAFCALGAAGLAWAVARALGRSAADRAQLLFASVAQERTRLSDELARVQQVRDAVEARLAEAQRALSGVESDRAVLDAQLRDSRLRSDELRAEVAQGCRRQEELQAALSAEQEQRATLAATLREGAAAAEEKIALLLQQDKQLADKFDALSAEALRKSSQSFLELAKTQLETFQQGARGDLEQRQQAIVELVKPVHASLQLFDGKLQEIELARVGAYEGLKEQVTSLLATQGTLRSETANLVKALRAPSVRGRWAEIHLKRVVEMAGMVDHCDFFEQVSITTEDGRLRPDMVVRLPGGKSVVVDAKAPLQAYLDAHEATDEETRKARLEDHARQVRTHLADLGRKAYWEQFQPAPEFVILFLPNDGAYLAALELDPSLIEAGVSEKVILATPTTLIAVLRAVAYGWRQERVAENAQAISELGRDLYKRVSAMAKHLAVLGKRLGSSVEAYNETIGSIELRLLPQARKLKDKAGSSEPEIDLSLPIEPVPRSLHAAELTQLPLPDDAN
jgi:DNA recombination protein RmuC